MNKKLVQKVAGPFRQFLKWEAAKGFLLIAATVLALILANSPWSEQFADFWKTSVSFTIEGEGFSKPLLLWVNDGLMAVFFFLIGLEIKREIIAGELATLRKASLPFFAAVGGMIVPIGLFLLFHNDAAGRDAWGIPMATDIAFSLGILSMLGSRAPAGLIVFLTAFAIVDDIGAILVIALFYAHEVQWTPLLIAGGLLVFLVVCNRGLKVRRNWVYLLVGVGVWYYTFKSGLHPTIAGVLVALTIPARHEVRSRKLMRRVIRFIRRIRSDDDDLQLSRRFHRDQELNELFKLKQNLKGAMPPLQRLEYRLENFVGYVVIPVFALANAGVPFSGGLDTMLQGFTWSIMGAMVLGKLLGVFSFTWLSVKLGLADLPARTRWVHILGAGFLGGIGFTMAIFIANLALTRELMLNWAKLGILLGSLTAGLSGYLLLRVTLPGPGEDAES